MKVTMLNNQSLLDTAVQYCGSANAAFSIAEQNNLSITDDLKAGQIITISQEIILNKDMADYYRSKGILPATAFTDAEFEETQADGIGEMIIENTFIVR